MSNQTAIDYEKQFQADLAKATALSLEQQALDEYNRTKKYGTVSTSNSRKTKTENQSWQKYAKLTTANIAATAAVSSQAARFGGGQISQLPKPQQRRHSDIAKYHSTNVERTTERSKTPPTITAAGAAGATGAVGAAENDLINFSSCITSKENDKTTFENLIADLQKIHTTNSQTILMPLGPTAAAPIYPPYLPKPPGAMLVTPIAAAASASAATAPPIGSVQLIPLHSGYQQQKVPLTNEELSKLYNMPLPHPKDFLANRHMGLVPSPMGIEYYKANPAIDSSTSSINYQPYVAPFKYQDNYAAATNAVSSSALQRVNKSLNALDCMASNKYGTAADTQQAIHPLTSTVARSRRFSSANSKQCSVDDLIDLTPVDDFHVSVLEVFDPLLNPTDKEDDNDNASETTSYYAEYDPFDYLYSGGSAQYSDPVYEAVNKLDKCSGDNSNIITKKKRNHMENERRFDINTSEVQQKCKNFSSSLTPSPSPPPPLPPRHIQDQRSNTSLFVGQTYESHIKDGLNKVLDRRKTCKRLYEIVSGQHTIDEELLDFFYMIKALRQRYHYDDESTNVGHIVASEFNYHYPMDTSIKILVHPALNILSKPTDHLSNSKAQFKGYGAPVIFTCDINTPVEIVIGQAFCCLEGQLHGSVNDYVVKPIGVLEWLSNTSKLSQLECVHNSLKLEKDVQLGLCLKTEENMKIIARMDSDDLNDMAMRPEDILPNETAASISYDNMMILIETFETEIDKLEISVNDFNSRIMLSCSGVVQAVKAICALLGSIDTMEIADCIHELKRICENSQQNYSGAAAAAAAATTATTATTTTTPEIGSDKGDYAIVCLRPSSLLENIKLKCSQLRDAIQELIELYSNQFCVAFSLKTLDYSASSINVSCVLKPLIVSVNCLHRPPPNWKYDSYFLGVQINYGTRFISDPMVAKCSTDVNRSLFPRLTFSAWITFEKNSICTLPLEARLIFVLYGIQMAENDNNSNDEHVEKNQITTELGWCAIQLFDFRREMICGAYLLSVWPPTADKFLGPAPARGCHPQPDICPVLSIEIPSYGGKIQFPEPLPKLPIAPRYDFSSLDSNLQQELLDTAEQGYTGAIDKREVFWEKRLYLQKVPHALPKVLHAAHSWDYASLMDLHSLLNSWSPLSPVQALELLLPRYPDAKVRSKAIEWISQFHNDQLVDYLPQLLQALKHDTYEASAMARFLLGKCLESPRIAHHMYCLLVHFLPGNDPQNSIDASSGVNEINESLITQARYYRRNKLMLRALLAICGEKLSKRLLLQNLMCKNLANIAENVKEAKEGLRQKVLFVGMDNVHQELLDKPTTLPLGPELVVTGINVRYCSYFNSNTLPLKISFIGPDKEFLPAIFKSGDDLQQDMLTIQLIRIMNKMWLADGLDLKIVTFDCVPTGYKKGMIELVSDAETLRKIQIEYGLTGPFKDRPIAEWLAKQNPSQLEYQRAVKNFTVSCAGYSVATYILGICDRHNDNIMLKTSGHLFHIDFGKFLGDAQMFGNFKRDRTPFVLTSDMAYVINGGDKPSINFHYFVDLCCHAFNIVRRHGDLLLHMLALMVTAGIPGVTADAVTYVRKALLPSQSNPEAAASFAKMIQFSLKSWFTQFNFFLHNLAQIRFAADEDSGELLSFVPRKYTLQEDGRLKSVMVVRCQKHYDMEKYYTYILRVTRHGQPDPIHLFRSYKEFMEFHQKLCLHFPLAKLHSLPSGLYVGRSNVKSVAEKRLPEIQKFLLSLFNSADEIAHSDLVYTFFHPLLRDQQEANLEMSKVRESSLQTSRKRPEEIGQLKLSLQYSREVLTVMIHHAMGLPLLQGGQEPNTYVKCYLKPDEKKTTKRKTKVVRRTCVPSYMETLEYRMPLDIIKRRTLHVTVWSHDTLQENELLGGFQIDLSNYNLYEELIDWFHLGYVSRH